MAKRDFRKKSGGKWPLIWLIQAVLTLALGAVTALSAWLGGPVHGAFLWIIMPLGGMAAGFAATRRGLNNYLAWLAPPLMEIAGSALVWGYAPPIGPTFLCGFVSLVGAAACEVLNRQNNG